VVAEKLEPTQEEIDEELETTAAAMDVTADLLRTNLHDTGRVISFNSEVAKMKASKWLSDNVTFVDPSGVAIDPAMLRVDQSHEMADESDDIGEQDESPDA